MPSSRPCRRSTSWQPAMQPWKLFATSKNALLQSVTRLSSASSSASMRAAACATADALQRSSSCDRASRPDRPVAEQAAAEAHGDRPAVAHRGERRDEIEHDVVVVAGVERDAVFGAGLDDAAHDVERAVAVERRDLDRDDVLDRGEAGPERERPASQAADGRLQVEADQRDRVGDGPQCSISASSPRPFIAARLSRPA